MTFVAYVKLPQNREPLLQPSFQNENYVWEQRDITKSSLHARLKKLCYQTFISQWRIAFACFLVYSAQ